MAAVETLKMLTAGALTTVQDLGRFGAGRFGVPFSGAVDKFSLRIGNLLVGNREDEAALEITVIGPRILVLADVVIAITGADMQPAINGEPVQMWRSQFVHKGDILSFRGPRNGCRAYLAIGGGISVPLVMGSRSTNLSAQFGGLKGRPLKKDDILFSVSPAGHLSTESKTFDSTSIPFYASEQELRVILGPQDHHFAIQSKELFLSSPFRVTPESDRVGIRLSGPRIEALQALDASIISEGVVPGAIQVPADAQPIILLGETITGGYRKIATVISADLPLLGQLRPGDRVRFPSVSIKEAISALKETETMIRRFKETDADQLSPAE